MNDAAVKASEIDPLALRSPTRTVRDFFEAWRGRKIYHPHLVDDQGVLVGNHGDRLMVLGTDILYRDFEIQRVDAGDEAELIVIGGSGGLLEKMKWIRHWFRTCCHQYPETPLCVLPSTFYYPTLPIHTEIGDHPAPVTLFCREAFSYVHLTQDHDLPAQVSVELDHDMAFELRNSDWLRSLRDQPVRHVLMVERSDVEHVSVGLNSKKLGLRRKLGKYMPRGIKRMVYPFVEKQRANRGSPFLEQCETILAADFAQHAELPRVISDVSNVNAGSFDDFCRNIAQAAVVFTTRLHVGIMAAMLDKPTVIFGGPYHKIRGMYHFSLDAMDHVRFEEMRP